jgi:nicotinamide mononucleotide adenylyltransferase
MDADRVKPPREVLLVACGSFSPPTLMHLRMMEVARDALLLEHGVASVKGVLSPVGAAYHLKGDLASCSDRLTMCELACTTSDWLSVDAWEASQAEYIRTGAVLDELARRLQGAPHQRPGGATSDAQVRLVCGADLLVSMASPGVWTEESLASTFAHGLVVFGGGRGDIEALSRSAALKKYTDAGRIVLARDWLETTLSSTGVRENLAASKSIKYLVTDEVASYIEAAGLYRGGGGADQPTAAAKL